MRGKMGHVERLGTLVWDTIGELFHKGETQLDLDSVEIAELRKTAYAAVKDASPSGRKLAYAVLEWLQGIGTFDAVKRASRSYEEARVRPVGR
jgi:hypothetical protein